MTAMAVEDERAVDPKLVDAVRTQLADIPKLYTQLPRFILPGSKPPDPNTPRASSNPARPPVTLDVIDLRDTRLKPNADDEFGERDLELDQMAGYRRLGVLPTLGLWVSMVAAELTDQGEDVEDCCPPHQHTIGGECDWLYDWTDLILEQHPDFADDINWIHKDLRQAVGESNRKPYHPRCPWCRDKIEGEGETGTEWFRCLGCGRTWTFAAEIRRLAATQPPMTLRQCSEAMRRPLKTLQRWAAELRFLPVGERNGVKVYDLEIIKRAAASVDSPGRPARRRHRDSR